MMKISAWKPAEIDSPLLPFPSTVLMGKGQTGRSAITMANRQACMRKIAQEVPQEEAMEQIPQEGQEQMQQQMDPKDTLQCR